MEYFLLDDDDAFAADEKSHVDSYFGQRTAVLASYPSAANPLVKTIVPPDAFGDPLFVTKEAPFIGETQNNLRFLECQSFPSFGERISHCASSLSIFYVAHHHDDGFEDEDISFAVYVVVVSAKGWSFKVSVSCKRKRKNRCVPCLRERRQRGGGG